MGTGNRPGSPGLLLLLAGDLDVITLNDVVLLDFLLGCPQNGLLRSSKQLVRRILYLAGVSGDFSPLAFFLSLGLRARQLLTKRRLSLVTSLFAQFKSTFLSRPLVQLGFLSTWKLLFTRFTGTI